MLPALLVSDAVLVLPGEQCWTRREETRAGGTGKLCIFWTSLFSPVY